MTVLAYRKFFPNYAWRAFFFEEFFLGVSGGRSSAMGGEPSLSEAVSALGTRGLSGGSESRYPFAPRRPGQD